MANRSDGGDNPPPDSKAAGGRSGGGPILGEGTGRNRFILVAICVLAGTTLGLGTFTFHYARGFAYFSTDPKACVNCHIMNPQFASWQMASHHTSAGCVDCHLPPKGLAKWFAKADNGYRHSKGFTFLDFHEPIRITEGNSRILQDNCLRCHGDLVLDMVTGSTSDPDALSCVHCHRDVGHGPSAGLGGPEIADSENPRRGQPHE